MPWITYEAVDVVGWSFVGLCLISTICLMWSIGHAPIEPHDDSPPIEPTLEDYRGRAAWHREQLELVMQQACEVYDLDFRDTWDDRVDLIESYVCGEIDRAKFDERWKQAEGVQ